MQNTSDISEHGWAVEPTVDGGARIQRSRTWRAGAVGCSLGMLLLVVPMAIFAWWVAAGFFDGRKEDWIGLLFLLIPIIVCGVMGLMLVAAVLQVLTHLLVREEWEASDNRLCVRRRMLGIGKSWEYRGGELLLDPAYGSERRAARWRVLVLSGGQRHYLLREPMFSVGVGGSATIGGVASKEEAVAFCNVLSHHTGWPVIEAGRRTTTEAPPACGELPETLRKRGFSTGLDDRLRQVVRPPKRGQYVVGLFILGFGGVAFSIAFGAASSFMEFAEAQEQNPFDPTFWVFIVPLVLIGCGLTLLGLAVLLGREQWTMNRNLLIVTSRLLGWKSERQYVDGSFALVRVGVRVRSKHSSGTRWQWQLQLHDSRDQMVKVLHCHEDDDSPRALGERLTADTGWPLRKTD